MERKKFLLQDLAYPSQIFLSLSKSEENLLKLLIKEGWLSSESEITCLDDKEYPNLDEEIK